MAEHCCFELGGALVHGDPAMDDTTRAALSEVIRALHARLANQPPDPEHEARAAASRERIHERNIRLRGTRP